MNLKKDCSPVEPWKFTAAMKGVFMASAVFTFGDTVDNGMESEFGS